MLSIIENNIWVKLLSLRLYYYIYAISIYIYILMFIHNNIVDQVFSKFSGSNSILYIWQCKQDRLIVSEINNKI